MPRFLHIAPDTKATITFGVLIAILVGTVTATVFVWDMKRDIRELAVGQQQIQSIVNSDHDRTTILWESRGKIVSKEQHVQTFDH